MVTEVTALTVRVVTVKIALLAPEGIVTVAGIVAAEVLLLVSVTMALPLSAGPLCVTVPVDVVIPPMTVVGLKEIEASGDGEAALKAMMEVLELSLPTQLQVPLWLPVAVTFLSAIAVKSLVVAPFRIVYPGILNALPLGSIVIAGMIRSVGFVVTMVGVA